MKKESEMDIELPEGAVSILPDSAFPFWWILIERDGKEIAIGAGKMDGLVCSKEELYKWTANQFAMEAAMQIQPSMQLAQPIRNEGQIEFIKKAIEEGMEVLKEVASKNTNTAKEFKLWKTKTFKN